jgi:vitamin B12 transporter
MDQQKVKNFYLRPNFTFNSILTIHPTEKLTISPSLRFVGSRLKGEYDEGPAKLPQYYNLDLYAGYTITNQFRAFIDLRNITNRRYVDIVGYNSRRENMSVGISFVN